MTKPEWSLLISMAAIMAGSGVIIVAQFSVDKQCRRAGYNQGVFKIGTPSYCQRIINVDLEDVLP